MAGGNITGKDVMNYSPPVGPKGVNDPQSPGLSGGVNNGPEGSQGGGERLQHGGRPGLSGGINHGCCGSQGKY